MQAVLRRLPSVDQVLQSAAAEPFLRAFDRDRVVEAVRTALQEAREALRSAGAGAGACEPPTPQAVVERAGEALTAGRRRKIRRVVNATGIILHTGLGRAVLPAQAVEAIAAEQRGYSLVAVEQATGERMWREKPIAELLGEITGCEAATVVNNNAGATVLILAELARGKEVLTSRGQLVEIGGSFRLPDVMAMSGARLVEVGTTNKTYVHDYERAITPNTGLLLSVHTSNYKVIGFTESVPIAELVALGRRHNLPVVDDLGSGALVDFGELGLADEPMVSRSVAAGADLCCFSGDKLIGGPQSGIVVGRKSYVTRLRKNPFFRALRSDKLTLAALEATLRLYRDRRTLFTENPTLAMISLRAPELERRAEALAGLLRALPEAEVEVVSESSQLGGGSMPGYDLPTRAVAFASKRATAQRLGERLRMEEPPVFTRVKKDRVLFDPRTMLAGDDLVVRDALARALAGEKDGTR
ncbi:MAG: L-seryl-tRNA(Sec) selenium transferase [Planctomycetes bacterium]|nr:L-seryl-tRNA(Sec) selenium transferase [Planctomycetota bacterium]